MEGEAIKESVVRGSMHKYMTQKLAVDEHIKDG